MIRAIFQEIARRFSSEIAWFRNTVTAGLNILRIASHNRETYKDLTRYDPIC